MEKNQKLQEPFLLQHRISNMNKKTFFIFYIATLFIISLSGKTLASNLTPTLTISPATTPSSSPSSSLINQLEQKVETSVSKLKLVEKRGMIGTVVDSSTTSITLATPNNQSQKIDIDNLTQFASPSGKTNFGISDIKKGMNIGVIGLYNKDSEKLLARFLKVIVPQRTVHATLIKVSSDKKSLSVMSDENKQVTISIGSITSLQTYDPANGLTNSDITQLKPEEHLIVIGYTDATKQDTVIAAKILLFPTLPHDPYIDISAFSFN